jgi:hypothetical protein
MLDARAAVDARRAALLRGAREWRDSRSSVRQRAREALRGCEWPSTTVERALGNVLLDFEAALDAAPYVESISGGGTSLRGGVALAILPGNILGPAIACAYCAALAGSSLILKSSQHERRLAQILVEQFDELGSPLRGSLTADYWPGGDDDIEQALFARIDRVIVFGRDETVASVASRVPKGLRVIAYGDSASVAFVALDADVAKAARAASWDVAMFDQRGCMSPQTIYVEGDAPRAILFAQALAFALGERERDLPRARPDDAEKIALADVVRRLQGAALEPSTHALGSMHLGQPVDGVPSFVVSVEGYSQPTCVGFGRVVVVKPCPSVAAAGEAASMLGARLETLGIAGEHALADPALAGAGARRICALGSMQTPPFGYRPTVSDFRAQPA